MHVLSVDYTWYRIADEVPDIVQDGDMIVLKRVGEDLWELVEGEDGQ